MTRISTIAAALLSLACVVAGCTTTTPQTASSAATPDAGRERLTRDTPRATSEGNTFIAPAGWSIVVRGPATILEPPEGDSDIALSTCTRRRRGARSRPRGGVQARRQVAAQGRNRRRTRTAGRTGALHATRPRPTRSATSGPACSARRRLDGRHLRHGAGRRREAPRAVRSLIYRRAAAEGLHARDVRRKEGAPLDARAHRGPLGAFVETAMKELGVPGRRHRPGAGRQGRLRRRLRRRELGKRGGRRRHAVHDRLEHEGDDDADARQARRREQAALGHAGHQALARRSSSATRTTTRQVLVKHLVCACTGLPRQDFEWLFEFKGATPDGALAHARHDAADQQVRRDVPVLATSWPAAARLHRRTRALPEAGARRRLRRARCGRGCSTRSA